MTSLNGGISSANVVTRTSLIEGAVSGGRCVTTASLKERDVSEPGNSGGPSLCGIRNSMNDSPSGVSQNFTSSSGNVISLLLILVGNFTTALQCNARAEPRFSTLQNTVGSLNPVEWISIVVRSLGNRRRPIMSLIARCFNGSSLRPTRW